MWAVAPAAAQRASGAWRPLFSLSLAFDRTVLGASPGLAHAHSLGWHVANVALLGVLARRVGLGVLPAALAMALFGLHPAAIEAVAHVSARWALLSTTGVLGATVLLLPYDTAAPRLALGFWATLLGFLGSEAALVAPLAVAAARLARWRQASQPGPWVATGAAVALWMGLRAATGVAPPEVAGGIGPMLGALAFWGRDLVVPVDIVPGRNLLWALETPWLLGAVGWTMLGLLVAGGGQIGRFGLNLVLLGLTAGLVAVGLTGEVAGAHLYLPLAGVAVAAASTLDARLEQRGQLTLVGGVTVACALLTGQGMTPWSSNLTLWRAATVQHPSPVSWGALGTALEDQGALDEAAHALRLAIQRPKPLPAACDRVAALYLKRDDWTAASAVGRRALANGCPRTAALAAPTALAVAAGGDWDQAVGLLSGIPEDRAGLALRVRATNAARLGDSDALAGLLAAAPDPETLRAAAESLLLRAGEPEAAAALRPDPTGDDTPAK